MKKSFFIIILALLTANLSKAQSLWDTSKPDKALDFGVRIGHNASNVNGETESAGTRSGLLAGVSVDYSFIKSLAVVSGLYYSSKGFYTDDTDCATLSYIQVPLQASYRIRTKTGVKFHFNLGPYFAYGIGGTAKLYPQSLSYFYKFDQDAFGDRGFFKRLDVGFSAGAHILVGHFQLGLTYEYGLTDIAKVYGNLHNRNVAVALGYNF